MRLIYIISSLLLISACHEKSIPNDQNELLRILYKRHDQWQGTPYLLGGYDHNGIDCSGFVALTFADEFEIALPRSTIGLSQMSGEITKHKLKTGDLVIFQIPLQEKYYHVGIYLEKDLFLHASTSKGVIISSLTNDYWHNKFWKAIRVLP